MFKCFFTTVHCSFWSGNKTTGSFNITPPELIFAVLTLQCSFNFTPLLSWAMQLIKFTSLLLILWKTTHRLSKLKRILHYLASTQSLGLHLFPFTTPRNILLQGFCDADWAADPDDRRSTSGEAVFFGPNLVSWWSWEQSVVAHSNAEAVYHSLALITAEIL